MDITFRVTTACYDTIEEIRNYVACSFEMKKNLIRHCYHYYLYIVKLVGLLLFNLIMCFCEYVFKFSCFKLLIVVSLELFEYTLNIKDPQCNLLPVFIKIFL